MKRQTISNILMTSTMAEKLIEFLHHDIIQTIQKLWRDNTDSEDLVKFKRKIVYRHHNDQESEYYVGVHDDAVGIEIPGRNDELRNLGKLTTRDLIAILKALEERCNEIME